MRVLCRHGHFAFYPSRASDIASFMKYYDCELVSAGDFYTFPLLEEAPKFSIALLPYLGTPALETFEGEPWEVMRENGFVYSIALGAIVPRETITFVINTPLAGFYFTSQTALIQPGSRSSNGQQILSYDAEYVPETLRLRVTEFHYE